MSVKKENFSDNKSNKIGNIGRYLLEDDNTWLIYLEDIITHLAKINNFTFNIRKQPSIIHATAREVKNETSEDLIYRAIKEKKISEDLALKPLATHAKSVNLNSLINVFPGMHDIHLRVEGIPLQDSFSSYIDYERIKIRELLKQSESSTIRQPAVTINPIELYLGTVITSKQTRPLSPRVKNDLGEYSRDLRLNFSQLTVLPVNNYQKNP